MRSLPYIVAAVAVTAVFTAAGSSGDVHPASVTTERGHAVCTDRHGCVVRFDADSPVVHLVFSADSMFEGGEYAVGVLDSMDVKASFFFTGNFLREPSNRAIVERIIRDGHYVGSHSNRHLLLADWDRDRTPLVTVDSLLHDLDSSYVELGCFGIRREETCYTLPPYEWCNAIHAEAYRSAGLTPVQPTPGVETYRDYTVPTMAEYRTAEWMFDQIFDYEKKHTLNGAIVIIHLGTWNERPDKLYHRLPAIIDGLRQHGYSLHRLP